MEDEIAEHHRVVRVAGEAEQVGAVPGGVARPVGRAWPEVESVVGYPGGGQRPSECAVACANLDGALTGPHEFWQHARKPAKITHEAVDAVEIATVVERVGMV